MSCRPSELPNIKKWLYDNESGLIYHPANDKCHCCDKFFEHYQSEQSNQTLIMAEQYCKKMLERKLEALKAEKDKEIAALQQQLEEVEWEIEEAQWEVSLWASS